MECIKNEDCDGRRKLGYKRNIASLEDDRVLLLRLLKKLRESDGTGVDKLLKPIRRGASLVEIERIITDQFETDVYHRSEGS